MTITPRPNKEALLKALDAYLDTMRPFVHRNLKQIRGIMPKTAIERALQRPGTDQDFAHNFLKNGNNLEATIDHPHFSWIISYYWRDIFRDRFERDNSIRAITQIINDLRVKASHPDVVDISTNDVLIGCSNMIHVLGYINNDAVSAIEKVRDNLLGASQTATRRTTSAAVSEPSVEISGTSVSLPPPRFFRRSWKNAAIQRQGSQVLA